MAKHYIGIDRSKGQADIAISTSTTNKAVEVVIDDAKVTNKADVAALLDHLEARLAVESFPPTA